MPLPKDPEIQIAIEERMRERRREASNSAEVEVALGVGSRRVLDFAKGIVTRIRGDENDPGTWEPYAAGAIFGGAATGIGYLAAGAPGALIGGGLALAGALRLGYLAAPEYGVRFVASKTSQEKSVSERAAEQATPAPRRTLLEMIAVPGGEFLMGSADDDSHVASEEKPQHRVAVRPFLLARTVVTRRQWGELMPAMEPWRVGEDEQLPANHVSWLDARKFCNLLSKKEGLAPYYAETERGELGEIAGGPGYRLPTEAEWEYACRAGTSTRYWSGDSEDDLERVSWFSAISGGEVQTVASKLEDAEHPFLLRDMHGNVWEWCEDRWHDNYDSAPTDGTAWLEGTSGSRVIRGGSFGYSAWHARSACRNGWTASYRHGSVGFRPARSGS
ncbi:MAG: formylglycine-generating enzyme family protein [Planctomycetes bacterium]|nr:formylglycine-generating enzyme family protein [Planctomycetota bacterium]